MERTFNILPVPCKGIESSTKHRPFFNNWFSSEHITTHVKRGLSSGAKTKLNDSTWAKILQKYVVLDLATCPGQPYEKSRSSQNSLSFQIPSKSLAKSLQFSLQNLTTKAKHYTHTSCTNIPHQNVENPWFIRSNDANTCELTVFSFTRFGSILLKEAPSSVFSRASGSAKRVFFFRAWRACWSAEREKTFHPSRFLQLRPGATQVDSRLCCQLSYLVGLFSSELTTLAAYNWGWTLKYIIFQLAEVVDASSGVSPVSLPKHGGDVRLILDGKNGFQRVLLPLNSSSLATAKATRFRNERSEKPPACKDVHASAGSGAWAKES